MSFEVIPAIDLRGGRCVRLRQGDYADETVFGDDPAAMAERWVLAGATRLHLVDLDGARAGEPCNLPAVQAILARIRVPCQLGGGVRHTDTVAALLERGLDRVIVGSRALRDPDWFRTLCGEFPGRIALGIDGRGGRVATDGWTATSGITVLALARSMDALPLAAMIYTDISRDGMLQGANVAAMGELAAAVRTPLIASGGVTSLDDLRALARLPLAGCIVGRALYEGTLTLPDALAAVQA